MKTVGAAVAVDVVDIDHRDVRPGRRQALSQGRGGASGSEADRRGHEDDRQVSSANRSQIVPLCEVFKKTAPSL